MLKLNFQCPMEQKVFKAVSEIDNKDIDITGENEQNGNTGIREYGNTVKPVSVNSKIIKNGKPVNPVNFLPEK